MASIDTTPSLVATNALQSIPFGSIIGAPLSACIEAQAKAARTSWEFIKEVGLVDTDDGKGKQAIYVNGLPELPLAGVSFRDCLFTAKKGVEIQNAQPIVFENVIVNGKAL